MWEKPNSPAGECPIAFAATSALGLVVSQLENIVCSQNQQWPQAITNGTTTRSPTFRWVMPAPTSTTSPMFSCPRMSPDSIVGW